MLKNPVYQVFLVRYCVFWHVQYQKQHVALLNTGLTTSPNQESHLPVVEPAVTRIWHHHLRPRDSQHGSLYDEGGRNFEKPPGEYFNQPTNQPTVSFFNSSPQKDGLFPGESGEKVCNFMVHSPMLKKNIVYTVSCGSFAYPCCLVKHLCSFPHERKLKGNPPFCGMGLGYLSCLLFPQTHKNRMLFVTPCMLQRLSHRNSQ